MNLSLSGRPLLIAALCLALASCATTDGRFAPLGDQRYPPRATSAPIDVFTTGKPTRPFIRIARLDAHMEKTVWTKSSFDEALKELRSQAQQAGADGIIDIQEKRSQLLETMVYHVTATAIRYTDTGQ